MRTLDTIGLLLLAGAGLALVATPNVRAQPPEVARVQSFGLTTLSPEEGPELAAVHVRLVVTNLTDDRPWTLDKTTPRLGLFGEPPIGAAIVNTDVTTLPIAIISRGERRVIDFYFPLPASALDEGVAAFELSYRVNTGTSHVDSRARFERVAVAPAASELALSVGTARYWWFDPSYLWSTYFHRPGIAVPRPPNHVAVTRQPRGEYRETAIDDPIDEWPRTDECNEW